MTKDELGRLIHFKQGDRDSVGQVIDWEKYDYVTMEVVDRLRAYLGMPIIPIRGAHSNRPEAVDLYCKALLSQVAMALTRFPGLSYGIYTGNSFHVDTRRWGLQKPYLPARWMGVRRDHVPVFFRRGLGSLFTPDDPNVPWRYLIWDGSRSLEALALVTAIAEGKDLNT